MSSESPSDELNALLHATVDAVIMIDERGLIFRFNRAAERTFGYLAAEVIGRNVSILMTALDNDAHDGYLARYRAGGTPHIIGVGRDIAARRKDGSEFPAHLSVGRIEGPGPARFVGYLHDISLRHMTVQLLEQERERTRLYLDVAQVLLVALDADGRVTLINKSAARVLGKANEELAGKDWIAYCVAPEDAAAARSAWTQILKLTKHDTHDSEYCVLAADGRRRLIAWRCLVLTDAADKQIGALASGQDVTDQRHAEQQAREARERMGRVSRLATMGELAAGIGHELNQPLAAISNYAQASARLLKAPQPDLPEIAGALAQIGSQALRAGDIIRRLRSLVRSEEPRRAPINPNQLVRDVQHLLATDARVHDGRLILSLMPDAQIVNVDTIQIQQVLLNLVHNAFEAMDECANGESLRQVTLATRLVDADQLEISCADCGPGVSDEIATRLFEPFFTTKSNGTGLGLAISRSILKAHNAVLTFRPNQPHGACFCFCLPTVRELAS